MEYTLKRSRRAKYMRLRVGPGGVVILTVPYQSEGSAIQQFLFRQTSWLKNAVARMMQYKALPLRGRSDYKKYKEEARAFLHQRVLYWNKVYNFPFKRIAIKNNKRIWGSCSRKGNLNFSYSLLFLPRELADYVVVHELCHLQEHNHGAGFWNLVARTLPHCASLKKELHKYFPRG